MLKKGEFMDNVEFFLSLYDIDFVKNGYLALLGRDPDPIGEEYYLSRMRSGVPKIHILSDLRKSTEGRIYNAHIKGLDNAIKSYFRSHWPLIGVFFRSRNESLLYRLNAIENLISMQKITKQSHILIENTSDYADIEEIKLPQYLSPRLNVISLRLLQATKIF